MGLALRLALARSPWPRRAIWRMRDALWQVPFDAADPANTPRDLVGNGPIADKLLDALGEANAELDADGVALDAKWGTVQAFRFGNEAIPVHGGVESAGVLKLDWLAAAVKEPGGIKPIHGSSYIQIVGFDETGPVADAILAYSRSTDPASPHSPTRRAPIRARNGCACPSRPKRSRRRRSARRSASPNSAPAGRHIRIDWRIVQ